MVVELDMERWILAEREGGAGLVPEQAAVGRDMGTADAVEDDDAAGGEHREDSGHDFFQAAAVSADEDGVGEGCREGSI